MAPSRRSGRLPIAFSQDGTVWRCFHPSSVSGGAVTGWLDDHGCPVDEHRVVVHPLDPSSRERQPGLALRLRRRLQPGGGYLLASGTLVNLSNGSTVTTGKAAGCPTERWVTASNAGLLRWQGTHSSLDSRFPGHGHRRNLRHGELIYFYGDSRPPLLLDTNGSLDALACRAFARSELCSSPQRAERSLSTAGPRTDRRSQPWPRSREVR